MRRQIIFSIFCLMFSCLQAQTLDTSLGTVERKVKKNGWVQEGPGGYEFFYLGGVKHNGVFILKYDNGGVKEEAIYKKGLYQGKLQSYYTNGSVKSTGRYSKGSKVGMWKHYYKDNSYEEIVYSRRVANEIRKSYFQNSNGRVASSMKTLRNVQLTKYLRTYHANGNLKLEKVLIKRFKKLYEIKEYYENARMKKHYFLQFDKETEQWVYTREYKEFNKNGKLTIHEYH